MFNTRKLSSRGKWYSFWGWSIIKISCWHLSNILLRIKKKQKILNSTFSLWQFGALRYSHFGQRLSTCKTARRLRPQDTGENFFSDFTRVEREKKKSQASLNNNPQKCTNSNNFCHYVSHTSAATLFLIEIRSVPKSSFKRRAVEKTQ